MTTFDYIKNIDALYISHLHPDHYDETILKQFRKDIPVIILDKQPNFLLRKLKDIIGFTNIIAVKDKETTTIGPFEVTVYAPFVNHPFDNSSLGNFIDSAIVIESNGKVILNANDNTPDNATGKMLYDRHGAFDIAQLKDSLAGAYPSCFINLSHENKLSEAKRLINRQLTAMCEVANILKTEWFQPFAGDYQLGGKLVEKNKYLGVAGKKYSAEFIASKGLKPLILNEQGSIDLVSGELKATYRKNIPDYKEWLLKVSKDLYDYEKQPNVEFSSLVDKLKQARNKLLSFQDRYNYYPDLTVAVNDFVFNMNPAQTVGNNKISFKLDNRALAGVLDRRYHFNNLEVGCHIEIDRHPNVYDPDLVNAMCWFHC